MLILLCIYPTITQNGIGAKGDMIKDLFEIPKEPTGKQRLWLKCMASIPDAKRTAGDEVKKEDIALVKEANELLLSFDI